MVTVLVEYLKTLILEGLLVTPNYYGCLGCGSWCAIFDYTVIKMSSISSLMPSTLHLLSTFHPQAGRTLTEVSLMLLSFFHTYRSWWIRGWNAALLQLCSITDPPCALVLTPRSVSLLPSRNRKELHFSSFPAQYVRNAIKDGNIER